MHNGWADYREIRYNTNYYKALSVKKMLNYFFEYLQNGGHFYILRLNISKTVNFTKHRKETKKVCNFIS